MRLGVQAALIDGAFVRGDVEVADGVVQRVGLGGPAGSAIAVPGFVDLQVNGFAGVDLAGADGDGYARVGEGLLEAGTTAYQPTFVSAPEAQLVAAVAGVPRGGAGPRIIGAHLEGPFLSAVRAGAHDPAMLREPDPALLARLVDGGRVAQVSLAPELPGALELVDALVARGIVVSAGHTDATAEEAHRGFDHGISTVTHLFNAMRRPSPRDPGIGFAALARDDVWVQVIVDGHHLADDTVRVAFAAAAGRCALVSDAVAAAGSGDGTFVLGGRSVVSADGAVRGPEGQLAGSTLTMLAAVRNLHALGVALEDALTAASAVPARIARRPELGSIAPGSPADVVVLDDRLEIRQVLLGGGQRVAA